MEHVEFQLEHFVSQEELPLAEELLLAVGTRGLTLAAPNSRGDWAVILLGDFSRVEDALRLGAESGAGLSTQVVDTHQGVDIFALVRRRSSGRESEIYLAALNSETLAASPDLPQVREMISRQQGILELPQALAVMVEDWGLSDFLQVIDVGAFGAGSGGEETPLDKQRFFGFHAQLADDSMTTLRALHQFDDEEQAAAAAAWLQEQTEPRWRNIGWGASAMVARVARQRRHSLRGGRGARRGNAGPGAGQLGETGISRGAAQGAHLASGDSPAAAGRAGAEGSLEASSEGETGPPGRWRGLAWPPPRYRLRREPGPR